MEDRIINTALANLEKNTGITANFTAYQGAHDRGLDGEVDLLFKNGTETFAVEVKKEIRNHQLAFIIDLANRYPNLVVIAENIFPKVKEELRNHNIGWLDTAGNVFLNTLQHHLWIEGKKKIKTQAEKVNRAFTPTGIKVLYLFLLDETILNHTYRDIAEQAGVALGNINYIINGLKEQKFLIQENTKRMKLINKNELLQKWMAAYEEKLKPTILVENFRFLKDDHNYTWKTWYLEPNETFWGGEPAGDLMTNYLKPEIFTLYTEETRNALIKKYRLIPDPDGKVKVYKKFWKNLPTFNPTVVHPLLAYTDLINTGDRRCLETAQKIYDELLRNQLQ
jgi:hypothetical protein